LSVYFLKPNPRHNPEWPDRDTIGFVPWLTPRLQLLLFISIFPSFGKDDLIAILLVENYEAVYFPKATIHELGQFVEIVTFFLRKRLIVIICDLK
jgi:hypothetical protein